MRYSSLVLFPVILATAWPGFAQDASLLRYDGPDRGRKLVAAAQKEGSFDKWAKSFEEVILKRGGRE